MSRSRLVLLSIILVILAAYVYLVEIRGTRSRAVREEAVLKIFPGITEEQPDWIRIDRSVQPSVRVIRQDGRAGGSWRVTEPLEVEADTTAVDRLLATLEGLKREGDPFPPGEESLGSFGLEPPELVVSLGTESGSGKSALLIGYPSPVGGGRYAVMSGESELFLIAADQADALNVDDFQLRQKHLFPVPRERVGVIEIEETEKPVLRLVRHGEWWRLESPEGFLAARDRVNNLLWQLVECEARSYESETGDNPAQYGLDPSRVTVSLDADGERITAWMGKETGQGGIGELLYARGSRSRAIVTIDRTLLELVLAEAETWCEDRLFPFFSWEVKGMKIDRPGEETRRFLEKDFGSWTLVEGGEILAADGSAVAGYLATLTEIRAGRIEEAGGHGAGAGKPMDKAAGAPGLTGPDNKTGSDGTMAAGGGLPGAPVLTVALYPETVSDLEDFGDPGAELEEDAANAVAEGAPVSGEAWSDHLGEPVICRFFSSRTDEMELVCRRAGEPVVLILEAGAGDIILESLDGLVTTDAPIDETERGRGPS